MNVKNIVKNIVPKRILNMRHLWYAWQGAQKYGYPSKELYVIGVTGTSGKSSTVYLIRKLLEAGGHTVGSLSTIDFVIAGEDKLNDQKMTMLGKMKIQEYLREMVDKGCDVAIVETTSEGALQHRHRFINYDAMVFTNLYPEHIESHGSFENYKNAKLSILDYIAKSKRKELNGEMIEKTVFVNGNDDHAEDFLNFSFERKYTFYTDEQMYCRTKHCYMASNILTDKEGIHLDLKDEHLDIPLYGEHNAMNALAAITVARSFDITWDDIRKGLSQITGIPGRLEFIPEARAKGFDVIVDYAFEPVALEKLYKVVQILEPKGKIIHVCGSTGGGRDKARRQPIGKITGEHADIVIVTNEDPYDEDPMDIIKEVAAGAEQVGKRSGENLYGFLDRQEAIDKAISLAEEGDLVLVTGKGSEQAICVENGKMIPWDDRDAVRRALKK